MSLGIFKLLKAAATSSKFTKAAKGVFTAVQVGDALMDVGQLSDEVARAVMGDNYAPALKEKGEEVARVGFEYDKKIDAVSDANLTITNLKGGIDSLREIYIDYGDKQALMFQQLERLDALKQRLITTNPTIYGWYEEIALQALASKPAAERRFEIMKNAIGNDPIIIGMASFGIAHRAAARGYIIYKRRKARNAPPPRRTGSPSVAAAVAPPDLPDRPKKLTKMAMLKKRGSVAAKGLAKGFSRVASVGSFAMNIFHIIEKVRRFEEAMAEYENMLQRYRHEMPIYDLALNGAPAAGDQNKVATFFEINIDGEEARAALAAGYLKIVEEYEANMTEIIDEIQSTYEELIRNFEESIIEDSDQSRIDALKLSFNQVFKPARAIALDRTKEVTDRKDKGIDKIRDEFISQISVPLNDILDEMELEIQNHIAMNMLGVYVEELVMEKKKLEEQQQKVTEEFPGLPPELLARLTQFDQERYEQSIQTKADSALTQMNIVAAERSLFQTREEIVAKLRQMIERRLHPAPAPSVQLTEPEPPQPEPPIHLTTAYHWLPTKHELPLEVSYNFVCKRQEDEFIPCFSKTKAQWGQANVDALSWYMSPHRDDFTFRTQMFGSFPKVNRKSPGIKPQVGRKYHMRCIIEPTRAVYFIDGAEYAEATYSRGTVPLEGHLGFAVFNRADILVENVEVKELQSI